jgi:hypothetical protein
MPGRDGTGGQRIPLSGGTDYFSDRVTLGMAECLAVAEFTRTMTEPLRVYEAPALHAANGPLPSVLGVSPGRGR